MTPWIAVGVTLAAQNGISIGSGAIAFEPDAPPTVCAITPRRLAKSDRLRLRRALVRAAQATMPSHVRYEVKLIRSIRWSKKKKMDCRGFVRVHAKGPRTKTKLTVRFRKSDEAQYRTLHRFHAPLRTLNRHHFEASWLTAWAELTPAAPPPPPPPPPVPPPPAVAAQPATPYVDQDLAKEQAIANAPPVAEAAVRRPPTVTVAVEAGWSGRTIDDAPGAEQSTASVPTVGGRATLHAAQLFGLAAGHDLEISVGYWRRLVEGQQADASVSVTADRAAVAASYRYTFAAWLPRVGPLVGYELVRFESDGASALSTRFSALRFGADLLQPVMRWGGPAGVWLRGAAALRWSPTGTAGLGVDGRLGAVIALDFGLQSGVEARLIRQTGETSDAAFVDQTLDLVAFVGWSI